MSGDRVEKSWKSVPSAKDARRILARRKSAEAERGSRWKIPKVMQSGKNSAKAGLPVYMNPYVGLQARFWTKEWKETHDASCPNGCKECRSYRKFRSHRKREKNLLDV